MDDQDIFIFDAESAAQSIDGIDFDNSVVIDLSNYGAAQPDYTLNISDSITIDGSNWDGIANWLEEREIVDQYKEEKRIRETHPAVQHAWEQYQIILNLAREESNDTNEDIQ